MLYPKLEDLNSGNCTEKYMSGHYPEFCAYINEHYPEDLKWTEKLYWFYHNINDYPKCPICGNPTKYKNIKVGYYLYCSNKCLGKSEDVKNKREQVCLERYGVKHAAQSKVIKEQVKQNFLDKYGVDNPQKSKEVREKTKQTCLERYGVSHYGKTKEYQEKIKNTCLERYGNEYYNSTEECKEKKKQTFLNKYGVDSSFKIKEVKEKIKQTNLERYGVDNPFKTKQIQDTIKQTCLEKYGVDNYSKTKEFLIKEYNTKKQNHSFNTSKIEQDFKKWLDDNNIEYKYQYKSDDYPFNCDFYFPKQDLYLEIQGSWVHGKHPFNPNDEYDQKVLQSMIDKNTDFYRNAIKVWTISDPKKRKWVEDHNLNWCELFTTDLEVIKECLNKKGIA